MLVLEFESRSGEMLNLFCQNKNGSTAGSAYSVGRHDSTRVLSFSLHIRPCSLLPILPFFLACCCCFFCASPFSFCFSCFSLLFVRTVCLFLLLFGVLLLFFLCHALFVLLSVLLAVICARPLPFFLLLSALLFNNHKKPAICSTAPRTAWT